MELPQILYRQLVMEGSKAGGESIVLAVKSSSSENMEFLGSVLEAEQAVAAGAEWHGGSWQCHHLTGFVP